MSERLLDRAGRHREVGMDAWGWEQLEPWLDLRRELSVGPPFCVIDGATRGRHWSSAAVRAELRPHRRRGRSAASAGATPAPSRLAKAYR